MILGPQSYQDCALPTELCQNLLGLPPPSLADFYYKFPLLNLLLYLEILKVFLRVLYHIWNKLCSSITRVCIYNKGLPTFKQVGASEYYIQLAGSA